MSLPDYSPKLKSVRGKIGRAQFHRQAIYEAMQPILAAEPETEQVATNIDAHRKEFVVTVPKPDPLHPALSLMVGDCVHNLRSALDHLVYQLALLNGSSTKFADKTFFPICLTGAEFNDRPKKLVKPYVSDAAFAEIEKSQPYSAYDTAPESDIWVLHKLDIIDKHRLLIVAQQHVAATALAITVDGQGPFHGIISDPKWKSMENGAELIRLQMTSIGLDTPNKVKMKVGMTRSIVFVDTGLTCDGMPVGSVLDQLIAMVQATVGDFGKQFFSE